MDIQDLQQKFSKIVDGSAEVNEIALAICEADRVYGKNPKKLSFSKLIATDSNNFHPVDTLQASDTPLPEVQYLRILCDVLLLADRGSHTELCNPESYRVAEAMDFKIRKPKDYADIATCTSILNTYIEDREEFEDVKVIMDFYNNKAKDKSLKGLIVNSKYQSIIDNPDISFDDSVNKSFKQSMADYLISDVCSGSDSDILCQALFVGDRTLKLKPQRKYPLGISEDVYKKLHSKYYFMQALNKTFSINYSGNSGVDSVVLLSTLIRGLHGGR